MEVFVTGGNGFIGSVVVRKLVEQGHAVRCLLREQSRTRRLEGLAYKLVPGDVRDAASVRAGVAGADGVLHLASLSRWTDIHSPLMPEVAVNGTSEPIIHNEDSVCTLPLRRRGGTSIVHVDDVAEGVIAALTRGRPGERYILGGENLSIRQLAELTLEILSRGSSPSKKVINVPNRLLTTLSWLGRNLHVPMPFNPAVIPYAVLYWFMDNGKAKRELGLSFRPPRAVLEPTLDWIESNLLSAK